VKELRGLVSAWISWGYSDFVEKFFVNRFGGFHPDDDYPKEKWEKFKKNPVSYMCSMDDRTFAEFTKAVKKQHEQDVKDNTVKY
jgi:hypothetical protein